MTRRILILEQDPEAQCVLGRFLARSGYSVAYATDGNDAADQARKSPYDLFLIDAADGDGLPATAFLRSLRAGPLTAYPAVVLLTSQALGDPPPPPPPGVNATVNKRARNFFDQLLDQINQALRAGRNPSGHTRRPDMGPPPSRASA